MCTYIFIALSYLLKKAMAATIAASDFPDCKISYFLCILNDIAWSSLSTTV